MRAPTVGLALLLVVAPATTLLAQQSPDPSSSGSNGSPPSDAPSNGGEAPALDVDNLGISVSRIKRRVERSSTVAETFDGRRLRAYIQVYGVAPPIKLFSEDELFDSPAPYGPMTHSEFLGLVTPEAFRSPAANLSNVGIAITDWLRKKAKERREEEERRRRRAGQY